MDEPWILRDSGTGRSALLREEYCATQHGHPDLAYALRLLRTPASGIVPPSAPPAAPRVAQAEEEDEEGDEEGDEEDDEEEVDIVSVGTQPVDDLRWPQTRPCAETDMWSEWQTTEDDGVRSSAARYLMVADAPGDGAVFLADDRTAPRPSSDPWTADATPTIDVTSNWPFGSLTLVPDDSEAPEPPWVVEVLSDDRDAQANALPQDAVVHRYATDALNVALSESGVLNVDSLESAAVAAAFGRRMNETLRNATDHETGASIGDVRNRVTQCFVAHFAVDARKSRKRPVSSADATRPALRARPIHGNARPVPGTRWIRVSVGLPVLPIVDEVEFERCPGAADALPLRTTSVRLGGLHPRPFRCAGLVHLTRWGTCESESDAPPPATSEHFYPLFGLRGRAATSGTRELLQTFFAALLSRATATRCERFGRAWRYASDSARRVLVDVPAQRDACEPWRTLRAAFERRVAWNSGYQRWYRVRREPQATPLDASLAEGVRAELEGVDRDVSVYMRSVPHDDRLNGTYVRAGAAFFVYGDPSTPERFETSAKERRLFSGVASLEFAKTIAARIGDDVYESDDASADVTGMLSCAPPRRRQLDDDDGRADWRRRGHALTDETVVACLKDAESSLLRLCECNGIDLAAEDEYDDEEEEGFDVAEEEDVDSDAMAEDDMHENDVSYRSIFSLLRYGSDRVRNIELRKRGKRAERRLDPRLGQGDECCVRNARRLGRFLSACLRVADADTTGERSCDTLPFATRAHHHAFLVHITRVFESKATASSPEQFADRYSDALQMEASLIVRHTGIFVGELVEKVRVTTGVHDFGIETEAAAAGDEDDGEGVTIDRELDQGSVRDLLLHASVAGRRRVFNNTVRPCARCELCGGEPNPFFAHGAADEDLAQTFADRDGKLRSRMLDMQCVTPAACVDIGHASKTPGLTRQTVLRMPRDDGSVTYRYNVDPSIANYLEEGARPDEKPDFYACGLCGAYHCKRCAEERDGMSACLARRHSGVLGRIDEIFATAGARYRSESEPSDAESDASDVPQRTANRGSEPVALNKKMVYGALASLFHLPANEQAGTPGPAVHLTQVDAGFTNRTHLRAVGYPPFATIGAPRRVSDSLFSGWLRVGASRALYSEPHPVVVRELTAYDDPALVVFEVIDYGMFNVSDEFLPSAPPNDQTISKSVLIQHYLQSVAEYSEAPLPVP